MRVVHAPEPMLTDHRGWLEYICRTCLEDLIIEGWDDGTAATPFVFLHRPPKEEAV